MTPIADVLDVRLLSAMVAEGYVRVQTHPTLPLAIYNYSEKATFDNVWNDVTVTCRGLIVDTTMDMVVARPLKKFFNHGQPGAAAIGLDTPVVVTDKLDGSLGILYPTMDGHAVATRGSFASDQAEHATNVWARWYAGRVTPPPGMTLLFEIVYPENRIVVDYGELDDLVLLGAVDIATGRTMPPGAGAFSWPGAVAERFPYVSLAQALAAEPRPNREGLVVHCLTTDARVKIKQEDYVQLHRIVTGLNARVIWRQLLAGQSLDEVVAPLPDEFHPWCRDVAGSITAAVDEQLAAIEKAYAEILAILPSGFTRKQFAAVAVPHPLKWALFLLLDQRDPRPELWKRAEPTASWTPSGRTYGEDTA